MAQLAQTNVTMNAMHTQLKTLVSAQNNQSRLKTKFYYWSCRSNFAHGSKTCSAKKSGHQEEAYYKKRTSGSEKGRELRLGAIGNKIKIRNPKISLINHIDAPPNPTSTNMIEIADSGANIHLAIKFTPTMAPVIMDNAIKERLQDGITMESTHIATLQLPSLIRIVRQIHISLKCIQPQ